MIVKQRKNKMNKTPQTFIFLLIGIIFICNFILAAQADVGGGIGIDLIVVENNNSIVANQSSQNVSVTDSTNNQGNQNTNSNTHRSITSSTTFTPQAYQNSYETQNKTDEKINSVNGTVLLNKNVEKNSPLVILLLINTLLFAILLFFLFRVVNIKKIK